MRQNDDRYNPEHPRHREVAGPTPAENHKCPKCNGTGQLDVGSLHGYMQCPACRSGELAAREGLEPS